MTNPRAYDLSDPAEIARLLHEVRGYIHTCRREHHGTDFAGRQFAWEALDAIQDGNFVLHLIQPDDTPLPEDGGEQNLTQRPAYWTHDDEAVEDAGHLYYFAPVNRSPGPYTRQREVEAIIDIADDGTLAGVELINNMPPPPPSAPPQEPSE